MAQASAKPMAKWIVPGLLIVLIVAIASLAIVQYSENASLSSQVSSLQSQVNGLQGKVNNYQSLLNLTVQTTWLNLLSFQAPAGNTTKLGNFTAGYAGYMHITTALNITNCCYVRYTDSFYVGGNAVSYFFQGTQSTLDLPVLPGTISLSFNNGGSSAVGVTIKIVYYS